mmetsp:Transcript_65/g.101  ORF Transcript_65/g.101 Transcript_65/m.101 type:complete len:198 (-) Transcript_65:827-1420(-)
MPGMCLRSNQLCKTVRGVMMLRRRAEVLRAEGLNPGVLWSTQYSRTESCERSDFGSLAFVNPRCQPTRQNPALDLLLPRARETASHQALNSAYRRLCQLSPRTPYGITSEDWKRFYSRSQGSTQPTTRSIGFIAKRITPRNLFWVVFHHFWPFLWTLCTLLCLNSVLYTRDLLQEAVSLLDITSRWRFRHPGVKGRL